MILAYIDPGAGSLVIQAALAAVMAVPFIARARLASVLRRMRSRKPESPDQPAS